MSLIIHDEYVSQVGDFAQEQGALLEQAINKYVKIMEEVCENGIMQGNTSKALKEFIKQVQNDTIEYDTNPEELGKKVKRYGSNFICKIDNADKGLY